MDDHLRHLKGIDGCSVFETVVHVHPDDDNSESQFKSHKDNQYQVMGGSELGARHKVRAQSIFTTHTLVTLPFLSSWPSVLLAQVPLPLLVSSTGACFGSFSSTKHNASASHSTT
eukprot:3573247-Amphidinium_carterae.1